MAFDKAVQKARETILERQAVEMALSYRRERIAVAVLSVIIGMPANVFQEDNVRRAFEYADMVIAESDKEDRRQGV